MFYKAIKEKYPDLTLISNYGLEGSEGADTIEMVDPHWYVEPKHFFNTTRLIDNYERGKHDIYVGEYSYFHVGERVRLGMSFGRSHGAPSAVGVAYGVFYGIQCILYVVQRFLVATVFT